MSDHANRPDTPDEVAQGKRPDLPAFPPVLSAPTPTVDELPLDAVDPPAVVVPEDTKPRK